MFPFYVIHWSGWSILIWDALEIDGSKKGRFLELKYSEMSCWLSKVRSFTPDGRFLASADWGVFCLRIGTWSSRKRYHQRHSAWYHPAEPEFQMLSIKVNLWWRIRNSGCFVFKYAGRVQPQHGPSFIRVGILRDSNKLKKVLFFPKREKGVCFLHSGCLVYDRFSNLHIALRFFSANNSRYFDCPLAVLALHNSPERSPL